jgi:hypothetical protein
VSEAGEHSSVVGDELDIRRLIATVAIAADEGDLDSYSAVWCDDARWMMKIIPPGADRAPADLVGRHAIVASAGRRIDRGFAGPASASRHAVTTSLVTVDDDTGRATSYVTWYRNTRSSPEVALMAVYDDEFRRTTDGWRFSSRTVRAA